MFFKTSRRIVCHLIVYQGLFAGVANALEPFHIGMDLSSPPFETIDTSGRPIGVGVDIATAFCAWMKRPIDVVNTPFIGLIPSLQAKKIDMILSSMTPTNERKKAIAFSDPYLSIGLCLLLSQKSRANNAQELNKAGATIVVRAATTAERYASSLFAKAKILTLEDVSSCIMEVLQGTADAFLYDQITVFMTWQKYPLKTKVDLQPIIREYWCAGLRKEDAALRDSFNTFLAEFTKSGGLTELQKKYLRKEDEAFKALGTPLIFAPKDTLGDAP